MKWAELTTVGRGVLRGASFGAIVRRVYGLGATIMWSSEPGNKWIEDDGLEGVIVRKKSIGQNYPGPGTGNRADRVYVAYDVLDHITASDFR